MQTLLTNSIICGDCRDRLKAIPDESVDLIYLDPPFFSGKTYEIIWEDGYEVRSFEDGNWYKVVCGNPECGAEIPHGWKYCKECGWSVDKAEHGRKSVIEYYIGWLKERLEECYRVLKPTGSIYVHLDYHAVHYVKVMMDGIFGYGNFQNDVVWCYTGLSQSKKNWVRKHDTILFYTKSSEWTFNHADVRVPVSEARLKRIQYGDKQFKSGKAISNKKGKVPEDWWVIPVIGSTAKERLGYPTQKPESLLERIIKASSNPGDLVLDPFCGCGTALAVAQKLNRRWIGIDISPTSCKVMVERLHKDGCDIGEANIEGMPMSVKEYEAMDAFKFEEIVVRRLGGTPTRKTSDHGIDGWLGFKTIPIQVKQSHKIGSDVVQSFVGAMMRAGKKRGIIVAYDFTGGAYDEVKAIKTMHDIEVELKTADELFK